MQIECDNCKVIFTPLPEQQEFIASSQQKNMQLIMLSCPNCHLSFPFNPLGKKTNKTDSIPLRSPIAGSKGFISYIEDEKFYGCSETGAFWKKKSNLFRDIEKIIAKYPRRKDSYSKNKNQWKANKNEPQNIEELIEKYEERESLNNFQQD